MVAIWTGEDTGNKQKVDADPGEFSLVTGGPLYRLWRRAHLCGPRLELVLRRVTATAAITWLPLLILSLFEQTAFGWIKVPFLNDIEVHVRFLVALPILVGAEQVVQMRLAPAVKLFLERSIVRNGDLLKFEEAVRSATRLRNSTLLEVILLVLVYTVGIWLWYTQIATEVSSSWHSGRTGATLAGYWYVFVSIPLFQFILIRWYLRFFIWCRFLWTVSRLELHLAATHPDRAGGLGFLGKSSFAFAPILFAQGSMLAALIATRVLFDGRDILSFKFEAGALVIFLTVVALSPLLAFSRRLAQVKRMGFYRYGDLASRYVREFQLKWMEGRPEDEDLLGSADIQSLADLGNSFSFVDKMRLAPFDWKDVVRLAGAAAAPMIPLCLTVLSFRELVKIIVKIIL